MSQTEFEEQGVSSATEPVSPESPAVTDLPEPILLLRMNLLPVRNLLRRNRNRFSLLPCLMRRLFLQLRPVRKMFLPESSVRFCFL